MAFPQSHTSYPPPRFSAAYIAHLGMTTGRVGAFLAIVTSLALPLAVYALPASGWGADGPLPAGVALPLAATVASALVAFGGSRLAGRRPLPAAAAMTAGAAAALLSLWLWDGDASALILSALFVGVPALVLVVGSGLVAAAFIWERRRAPGDLARPILLSLVPLAFVGLAVFLPVMLARAAPEDRGALARLKGRDHQRVQVFQQDGGWVRSWGEFGGGDGQFKNPSGVAVGPGGGVYVVDADNNRVQRFDESGRFELAWGGRGAEDGQVRLPTAIALSREGNVYVSDTGNGRVQVFDPDGAFLGALGDESWPSLWASLWTARGLSTLRRRKRGASPGFHRMARAAGRGPWRRLTSRRVRWGSLWTPLAPCTRRTRATSALSSTTGLEACCARGAR